MGYTEQHKEDLTESTENYQLYNDTEKHAVVLKASSTFDESEPENEEICLIPKTPSKKQQKRIEAPHSGLIEAENISIETKDISTSKENTEKDKIEIPNPTVCEKQGLKTEHKILH